MGGPGEAHALELKIFSDERVQIGTGDEDVAAENPGRFINVGESGAQLRENFRGEKGDLPLVIFFEIVKAIAAETVTGDAFDPLDFLEWIFIRLAAGMAEKIMPG